MQTKWLFYWVWAGLFLVPAGAQAQSVYAKGDIVEDFMLVDRATGAPLRLSDFEGKIIFLEWFAWW